MSQLINRALVVDDSRLARIALSKLLQKRGVSVEVVGTGGEAIQFLKDQSLPDVVFMDYMMPDMDGFEATRQLRDEHQDAVPVVMYTSQDTADDREKARQLGIAGFLSKPSGEHNLDDVLSQLNEVIAKRASTDGSDAAEPVAEPAGAAASDSDGAPESAAWIGEVESKADETAEAAPADEAPDEPPEVPAQEPAPQPAPEPALAPDMPAAAAAPAESSAEPTEAMRTAARDVVKDLVDDALEGFARDRVEPLREQIGSGDNSDVLEQARQTAQSAAEEAAESVADRTARQIAENVAQETASRVSEEVGPEAAKRIMAEVREEVNNHVSQLTRSDDFNRQVSELFRQSVWPEVQQQIVSEVGDRAVEQAQAAAKEAATQEFRRQSEELTTAAERLVEEHVASLRSNLTASTRETVQESMAGLKRLVYGLGAGLGIGVALSFAYTFLVAG